MSMPICRIRIGGHAPHLSQICAGFTLLEQRGLLKIQYEGLTQLRREDRYAHSNILEAEIGGAILAYDVADGYEEILQKELFDAQLERVTRYFKRSWDPAFHAGMKNRRKMRPLGLNYAVTCRENYMDRNGRGTCQLSAEDYMSHNSYPAYKGLFSTRLWNPESIQGKIVKKLHPFLSDEDANGIAAQNIDDIERLNTQRMELIRACREAFGDRFCGGLEGSLYAKRRAPDLVLPPEDTLKSAFLRRLQVNYVCIATEGLHHSIGWKMAEYTTAGRAILSDPLRYRLPGEFRSPRNFIEFRSTDDCVRRLGELLKNPAHIHRLEQSSFAYYNTYVRPDALIYNTLRDIPEVFSQLTMNNEQ